MISAQHQESYTSCLIVFLKCRYSCHNFLKAGLHLMRRLPAYTVPSCGPHRSQARRLNCFPPGEGLHFIQCLLDILVRLAVTGELTRAI